ncbi:SGNH/GDSL hydrolase family protein [Streptomyces sp. NPDC058045]|uniref:SGNH/GDSL hydrolase family protein n=1 Tax=Streptomyces sp. NPDC058045 TaxID=3346311 RepID=UPI0036EB4CC3
MRHSRTTAYAATVAASAALALTGALATSASAQAEATGYVALGDSYSSGVGSGSYDGTDCKRSSLAYPQLYKAAHSPSSFDFKACSGAITTDVLNNQVDALNAGTGLVSITIGGNDGGFTDVMLTCVLQSEKTCLDAISNARSFVENTLPGRLDQVYSTIRSKAPNAHVAVLGYPRFYKLGGTCSAGLSETKRAAINDASNVLNGVIAKRAADHGFSYGDIPAAFTGHEICSSDSWMNSLNWGAFGDSYHPKATGQKGGYLPVLEAND